MNADDASTQLLTLCVPHLARTQRPWRLALAGLPGCGKTTLAAAVVKLAQHAGWTALALSLDDFYWPRGTRLALAAHIHPLLATRGVPGTHDLALLNYVLTQLPRASRAHPVAIPRFDKGRDTRVAPSRWNKVHAPPQLVILEGWCLGITPQPDKALVAPLNALERTRDRDGRWRAYVNRRVADYLPLWDDADNRALIRMPDWRGVQRQRRHAEQALRARHAPHAMDDATLRRFLQHYERLGRWSLRHPPERADLVLDGWGAKRARAPGSSRSRRAST